MDVFTHTHTYTNIVLHTHTHRSRVDASDCLDLLLPQSISVFAFDFSGSGLSDGETISLGFYEQDDLMAVIEYLRARCVSVCDVCV
jgi:alpha/beta superfamily hydrolase